LKLLETTPKGLIILEAQNGKELRYLNKLIRESKAWNSGDKYQVLISLKEGKTKEGLENLLKERGFKVEMS